MKGCNVGHGFRAERGSPVTLQNEQRTIKFTFRRNSLSVKQFLPHLPSAPRPTCVVADKRGVVSAAAEAEVGTREHD
jgi:hypothetical protein